jgi:hypothetical protein
MTSEKRFATGKDRLRFALEFAQLNLDRLREGDWLNLKEDFREFLVPKDGYSLDEMGGLIVSPFEPSVFDFTEKDFRSLQPAVRGLFSLSDSPGTPSVKLDGLRLSAVSRDQVGFPGRHMIVASGGTQAIALLVLAHLLARESIAVKSCRLADCGRLFLPVRSHQQFCSRRCVNRSNQQAFRKRKKERRRKTRHRGSRAAHRRT